ncbi:hypothetical protein UA38_16775 [Photobacterium kishitanii]|uniref:Uncharacterized protein n=1 Tax=Photobacterium kishitanii TaxID=318456 RepID=A0AAX0Z1B6_9GAMM|nr:hypothetical protein [Photobacterium kishitanii]KJG56015.1 hypothetical protein UA38_16775 [Photobacterium kishitanii]KJG62873.1 hypothetical protein UA42_00180 [Photobacterium kishitanii]KJG64213.1 hypothetical protein UA40_17910 [Photobacterium kishitanii]KJG68779.1 hypothetical protein UA41_15195 [Photobacterium kishitanii]PSV09442.1 hypothetical protein C0W28_20245 [Photobacterium kishitanii]
MQAVESIILLEIVISLFIGVTFYRYNRKKEGLFFSESDKCVYLNNKKILNLRSCSMNYRFMKYLFDNSNRVITEKELKDNVFFRDIYINKLVSNLNLPAEVRENIFIIENRTVILLPLSHKKQR